MAEEEKRKELPLDPEDPIFKTVNPDTFPPPQAYRYMPAKQDMRNRSRFIFYGGVTFDEDEERHYSAFM